MREQKYMSMREVVRWWWHEGGDGGGRKSERYGKAGEVIFHAASTSEKYLVT